MAHCRMPVIENIAIANTAVLDLDVDDVHGSHVATRLLHLGPAALGRPTLPRDLDLLRDLATRHEYSAIAPDVGETHGLHSILRRTSGRSQARKGSQVEPKCR